MRTIRPYVDSLAYGFHVAVRPFDGFWDLKREKRGTLAAALTFLALLVATIAIRKQNTAFLFNYNRLEDINAAVDFATVTLLYGLWVVANWCLTSLMDGEGHMADIAMATGYALLPLIVINLPLVAVSYVISADEGAFYHAFELVSVVWSGFLLITGMSVTHQYSGKKTLLVTALTLVGMAVILFIALLFASVAQRMVEFARTVYAEVPFR